jgi:hypothetical protein
MLSLKTQQKLHYTLRFATAMCFIGHGTFGIITKAVWCNYFAVLGIGNGMAYQLMPWLGSFDILCGIIMLVYPIRAIPVWLVIWGVVTALLRPLSGEPFAEFIERAGNFGAPLALLMLSGGVQAKFKSLFTPISPNVQTDDKTLVRVIMVLKVVIFLLLIGHGWLNLIGKKGLMGQYASLGFSNPADVGQIAGIFEIIAGISVLIKPLRSVLIAFFIWKVGTELFYPHWEVFEWIERGGSYGAILGLYFALSPQAASRKAEAVSLQA